MGRYGTDCANEVAYLLPELLARPPGMLWPDRLKELDHRVAWVWLLV